MEPQVNFSHSQRFIALMLFLTASLVIAFTIPHYGITWDEPGYVAQAKRIRAWFRIAIASPSDAISEKVISAYWPMWKGGQAPKQGDDVIQDRLNPPFAVMTGGFIGGIFEGLLDEFTAYRLIGAFSYALLIAVIFLWTMRDEDHITGLSSALIFALLPRIFAHAHIFATDLPATAFILLAVYFLSRPLKVLNVIAGSLFLGMAVSTKFTALIVPLPIFLWFGIRRDKGGLLSLVIAVGLAFIFMVSFYPGLWHETLDKLKLFFILSSQRSKYIAIPTYYFAKVYWYWLPWHHPWVMVFGTMPLVIVVLFSVGAWCVISSHENSDVARLSLLIFLVLMLSFMAPNAPGHDGMRLFMPAMPFLAIVAGTGFKFLWNKFERRAIRAMLVALAFLPGIWGIISWHPYQLCYYGLVLGGGRGAHRLGMETTYWGDVLTTTTEAQIRKMTEGSAKTFYTFCEPIAWRARTGRFGDGAMVTSDSPYWTLMFGRQGIMNDFERVAWEWGSPIWEKRKHGVRLVALFETSSMYVGIREKLEMLKDRDADKWYYLGLLAEVQGNPSEALNYFKKAFSLDNRHERALLHLGRVLRELGRYSDAIAIFEGMASSGKSAELYVELARSYAMAGETKKALDAYKNAMEIHLNYPFALDEYLGLMSGNWTPH